MTSQFPQKKIAKIFSRFEARNKEKEKKKMNLCFSESSSLKADSIVVSSYYLFWCSVIWMLTYRGYCDITSGFGSPASILLKALYLNLRKSDASYGQWTILNFLQISLACLFNKVYINRFLKLSNITVFLVGMLLVLKDLWKLFVMYDHSRRLLNRTELYIVTYGFSFYSSACRA